MIHGDAGIEEVQEWRVVLGKPVGRQLWWKEFKRDDDYIESLEEDLWEFKLLVDGYEAALRSKAA